MTSRKGIYPFPVQLIQIEGQPPVQGQIVLLTAAGFLVQFPAAGSYRVGDQVRAQFQVPGATTTMAELMTVIKSYFTYAVAKDGTKSKIQVFEMHFVNLDASKKNVIDQFVQNTEKAGE